MTIQDTPPHLKYNFPDDTFRKWQKLLDLLSNTFNLPASLIMRLDGEWIKVFAKSNVNTNPYIVDSRERLHGLYCNTVINSKNKLLISNALKDAEWMDNPDIKHGMIAYLGFPIILPDGDVFGTICVLDSKENQFNKDIEALLSQIKEIIELDIASFLSFESKSMLLEKKVMEQAWIIDKTKESHQEIQSKLNTEQDFQNKLSRNNERLSQRLQQTEIKYSNLINRMQSAVVVFSPLLGDDEELIDVIYLDMNTMNEKLIGFRREDVLGKGIMEVFPGTEQAWLDTFKPIVRNGETVNIEMYHKPMDKHFSLNGFPIDDCSFCVCFFDISEQVRLKEKIERSEWRYKSFYNSIEAAIVIFDPIFDTTGKLVDLRYVDMNPVNEKIINSKKEFHIGKTHSEAFPDSHERFLEHFKKVVSQNRGIRFEEYYSFSSKYFSINIFPIDEGLIAFTCYDITESVQTKQKLEASEKRHKAIFNNSSSAMVLIDSETGEIIDGNDAILNATGYSRNELKSLTLDKIVIGNALGIDEQLKLSLDKNKKHFEIKARIKSGQIRNIEVYTSKIIENGKIVLHCIVHDITDKKNAFNEILKLSKAVEQSPVSIVITDTNGTIEYTNPKNCELTGYTADELISKNPRVLKSGKLSKDIYTDLWNTILAGEKWEGEFYNRKKDDSFYWEFASIAPITDEEGNSISFIKIGTDITDRKMMELELRKSKLKAEESDRLKTAFLANLSHEIRTPLNGILGFTSLVVSEDTPNEVKSEYGNIIQESGDQLIMIIDDLVKIAQIEAGHLSIKYSDFSISDLFQEIHQFHKPEITAKKLDFKITKNSCGVCTVRTDHKRIRQVFDNLMKNAIKFTDQGEIALCAECHESHVLFSLKDTGIGISKMHQKVIFNRFRQIENHNTRLYGGNGLGLSISKEIVELLGGELWIESEVGKGSTFKFTIPLQKNTTI